MIYIHIQVAMLISKNNNHIIFSKVEGNKWNKKRKKKIIVSNQTQAGRKDIKLFKEYPKEST